MATSPARLGAAIEIERTIKTSKRYEQILATYLIALKSQQVHKVVWLSPTDDLALRLLAIILGIPSVAIKGQSFAVDPHRHHGRLSFLGCRQWPMPS